MVTQTTAVIIRQCVCESCSGDRRVVKPGLRRPDFPAYDDGGLSPHTHCPVRDRLGRGRVAWEPAPVPDLEYFFYGVFEGVM